MNNWRGFMYYEVNANPGWQNVYGHYTHQNLPAWLGISIGYGSLSVSPSIATSDANDTDVSFYVD